MGTFILLIWIDRSSIKCQVLCKYAMICDRSSHKKNPGRAEEGWQTGLHCHRHTGSTLVWDSPISNVARATKRSFCSVFVL